MAGQTKQLRGVRGAGSTPTRRSDGRWEAKLDLGVVAGKRARKTFYGKTRREAQEKLHKALYEHRRGLPVPNERLTLRDFFEHSYLPEAQRLEAATYRLYEQMARVHIVPALGHLPLAKLTVQQVQTFLNGKSDGDYATRTVEIIRAVLRQALGLAETWGMVPRNVAKLVKVPRAKGRKQRDRRFLSVPEAERLFEAAKGDRLEALYSVALMLGLRQGEALGLRWNNVDLEGRTATAEEAVHRVKGEGLRFKDTKTHQSRTLPLPVVCVAVLREHKRRQNEERLAAVRWQDNNLVFCTRHGTPLDGTNVTKYFKALLARASIPPMRYYDLRHSAASLMAARGVPARLAMEILGHSDIRLTLNVYTHVLDESKRQAADAMDRLFGGGAATV